jgi:hypothetical protein
MVADKIPKGQRGISGALMLPQESVLETAYALKKLEQGQHWKLIGEKAK